MESESPTPPPNPYLQNGFFNIVIKNPKNNNKKEKMENKPTLFVCDLCDKQYGTNKSLTRHYNLTHRVVVDMAAAAVEKETCEFCENSFPKVQLKEHYIATHEQNYNTWAICEYCHKSKDISHDNSIMDKHLKHCEKKKERDSEEIMLKIADINVGKMVNCYVCNLEVPIKEIKKHAATCSRNKSWNSSKENKNKKKEIQCDLCQKKFTYNTALYKHFKNVHHQTYKKRSQKREAAS